MITPSFDAYEDATKLFYETTDENGDTEKHIMRLIRATVVVTTAYGTKVAFGKSNRGRTYVDSRGRKVEKKNDWGDKTTVLRTARISAEECKSELYRLLDSKYLAEQAFRALDV